MGKERARTPQDRRKAAGQEVGTSARSRPPHTPVTSLRIPAGQLAQADELVPLVAASGEMVGVSRSLVLRLALAEGLKVLARRYGRE